MIYMTIDEAVAARDTIFRQVHEEVTRVAADEAVRAPGTGGWNVAAIIEHVARVEESLIELISKLLARLERETPAEGMMTPPVIDTQAYVERSRREKYVTQERFEPTGAASVQESLDRLMVVGERLNALLPRLRRIDHSRASFPHKEFGPLTLGEWVAFLSQHEEQHLLQIHAVLQALRGGQ